MEDFPIKTISLIAIIILTAGLLTFGYMFYKENGKVANITTQNITVQKNNIKDQRYMDYDETLFQGSGVLRTIKLFQNEEITIQVWHGDEYDEFLYTIKSDGNLGTKKDSNREDYDAAKYRFSDSGSTVKYIDPDDEYDASLIYSPVGAIIGIKFTQK